MRYRNHDDFAAPARSRSEIWRTALGFFLTSAAQIALIFVLYGVAGMIWSPEVAENAYQGIFFNTLSAQETLLLLLSTGLLTIGLIAVVHRLHKRSFWTLFGQPPAVLRDFWSVFKALTLLYIVLSFLPSGVEMQRNMDVGRWLLLLPLALPVLFIQISSEELFYRGYLQQQLAARYASPVIWMGLPSLIFAYGHYNTNMAGDNAILTAVWAGLFGLAAADLTGRSGNLGAALALHFTNNFGALLLASLPGQASGLALYTYPIALDDPAIVPVFIVDLGILLVSWLAARVALRL